MMLNLKNITLIAVASRNIEANVKALDYSRRGINFGKVKIVSDIIPKFLPSGISHEYIEKMISMDDWNHSIIYKLGRYIDTPFAILIHPDGFVVNPESWQNKFLNYDYIGAPWPLPTDNFSYRDHYGKIIRVGNSVGLRSKRLINLPNKLKLKWRPFHGYYNEDGFISVNYRHVYIKHGMKFADIDTAKYFAHGNMIPEVTSLVKKGIKPFMFHRYEGTNWVYPKVSDSPVKAKAREVMRMLLNR